MKFFAVLAVASMAIAAPVALNERAGPGKAPVVSSSSAPAATATQDCYNNACGGGYPWKRDDEVEERAVEEDLEARAGPGKAPVTSSSAAPAATATQDCYNNACGGGYPWKRDDEVEERDIDVVLEERAGPGKAPVTSSSAAPAATATQDCYNNACGGGYPWKREDGEVEERDVEVMEERFVEVIEDLEARAGPGKAPVTSSSAAPAATATQDCYNNACGGGYPWK